MDVEHNPATGRSALIVEDDPAMADILMRTLKLEGFESVFLADSSDQALDRYDWTSFPISVVILDLVLKQGDAFEVLPRLAERHYQGHVILVTGEDQRWLESARSTAQRNGLNVIGTFHKPFSIHDLRKVLARSTQPAGGHRDQAPIDGRDLSEAIDGMQIEAVFQPKVAVADGELRGFEALARWNHPIHGLISPASFIGLAEQLGLIDRLTNEMLDQAFAEAARLKSEAAYPVRMSVNLSGVDLSRRGLGDEILAKAEAHRLVPNDVILEVTETQVLREYNVAEATLKSLALRGFLLSMDDFGTGYSNIDRLQELPFSELKLDRSFVNQACVHENRRKILKNSIRIGRDLALMVVGEGVETYEDWQLLREMGCHMAQGFYFGHPMRRQDIDAWIERHNEGLVAARGSG